MEYLTHLRLLQKNKSALQNYPAVLEHIFSSPGNVEELRKYLRHQENFIFQKTFTKTSVIQQEIASLNQWRQKGFHFVVPGENFYPHSFWGMPGAPLTLNFYGHPSWKQRPCLSVVGSRVSSSLSHLWMEDAFASFLRQEKPVVVSGGARGIDQMAHQLALRNSCPTVVVVPSGLERLYPEVLVHLKNKIIDGGGCLLSEYSPDEEMRKHFFHDRNRLIAGLGSLTLVIEAKRRSGSLLTAQKSLQLGKSVLVVPGHPCDSSHLGNLDLFTEGATPIRDAQDLSMYFRSEVKMASFVMSSPSKDV